MTVFCLGQYTDRLNALRSRPKIRQILLAVICLSLQVFIPSQAAAARLTTLNGDTVLLTGSATHHQASGKITCASGKLADLVRNTVVRVQLDGSPAIDAIAYCMDDGVRRSSSDNPRSKIVYLNNQRVLLPGDGLFLLKKTNLYCENGTFATLTRNFSAHAKEAAYIRFDAVASCGGRQYDQVSEGKSGTGSSPPGSSPGPGPGGEGEPQ